MLSSPNRKSLLACAAVLAALALESGWLHWLQPLEHRLLDSFVRQQAQENRADPDIVIVDIDERSLAKFAETVGRWPWPRAIHGELIEGLQQRGVRAIVFDILFSDADLHRIEGDEYFAAAIRASDNTYFPMLRLEDKPGSAGIPLAQHGSQLGIKPGPGANPQAEVSMVLPLPAMLESGRLGTHNALADADKVVRRYYVHMDAHGWRIPSLPARVAQGLGYGLPEDDVITLNWRGAPFSYRRVSYWDLYEDLQQRHSRRPADEFRNRIVIVGATATGLHDIRATPVDGFFPGVEILATALDNLKHGDPLRHPPAWLPALLGGSLVLAVTALFLRFRHPLPIGLGLSAATLALLATSYQAIALRWLLPVLSPLALAWTQYAVLALQEYLDERKTRLHTVATFGRFLDPRVVDLLVRRGETSSTLSGHNREISVLFSDIRGFTTLSESNSPEVVVDLLNRYFNLQAQAIFEHAGTLDKYIGDAIMAFWGAPADQPDHALRAVAAALVMSERLEAFRLNESAHGRELEIGIGVHSGPAVVGFIGADCRQDYTAIGDTVNLSSRIEGLTKGISRVLVSEDTRRLCEEQSGSQPCPFEFIDHGSHEVKGRAQPVRLFEPRKRT